MADRVAHDGRGNVYLTRDGMVMSPESAVQLAGELAQAAVVARRATLPAGITDDQNKQLRRMLEDCANRYIRAGRAEDTPQGAQAARHAAEGYASVLRYVESLTRGEVTS